MAAKAYFFNMSAQAITQLNVNGSPQDAVAALGSAPYTPNVSTNSPYNRYDSPHDKPRPGEFDNINTVSYNIGGGGGGAMTVHINVNFSQYPVTVDLLIYLFNSAVIVMSPADSVPYIGYNNGTINVGPNSPNMLGAETAADA
jgi:hypothetical protein